VRGPESGLSALGGIPSEDVTGYQPYWALRGHLLRRLGRAVEAREALERAMTLSQDPAVRDFLREGFDSASESA
jgi:RNA polymerase sigma-70 factor, ECF subfamily